jgi:hypothetical protein
MKQNNVLMLIYQKRKKVEIGVLGLFLFPSIPGRQNLAVVVFKKKKKLYVCFLVVGLYPLLKKS